MAMRTVDIFLSEVIFFHILIYYTTMFCASYCCMVYFQFIFHEDT